MKQALNHTKLICFTGDSAHLFAPQEVTGQLRKSIILPCSYKASHFYTEKQVTWYFGKHGPILHRNASEVHTFPSFNQKKLSINSKPRSGNVSLTLENLQYSDMGTYTCEFPVCTPPIFLYLEWNVPTLPGGLHPASHNSRKR
uniref:Ig-like domain-containing protein n=1 Tax=Callorhinchus milii TaxID=7868 RepID=A0A4W3J5H9_CALMI